MRPLRRHFLGNLVVVIAAQIAVHGAADVTIGGTMVVAVRFRDGLVVCADKRSHLDGPGQPQGNYRDDDVKITLLDRTGGFVTAGVPILQRFDGVRVFDADQLIGDYLRQVGFTKLDGLARHVEDTFRNYVLSKLPGERPPTQWPDGRPVFLRAMVFFQGRKNVDLYDLELQYVGTGTPKIHATVQNRSQDRLRAYGTLVLKEIMGGSDGRFADLRGDRELASVLRVAWASQVTEVQALLFARRSIAVTSERIGLLDRSLEQSFGSGADCALARHGKGIEWLPYGK